jgi:hypothetical protein
LDAGFGGRERGDLPKCFALLLNHEGGKLPIFFAAKAVDMMGVGNLTLPNESLHVILPVTLDAQNSKSTMRIYRQWPSFMRIKGCLTILIFPLLTHFLSFPLLVGTIGSFNNRQCNILCLCSSHFHLFTAHQSGCD